MSKRAKVTVILQFPDLLGIIEEMNGNARS